MKTQLRGSILVTRIDDPAYNAIVNVLGPLGFDIHRAPWDNYLQEHVQITPFDIVIAGFSLTGGGLDAFLRGLRARGSASLQSGVILIASESHADLAREHVGHGANKVLIDREVSSRLQDVVSELQGIAPRVPLTANARIKIYVKGKPIQSFCQTRNLSATGVLIRGFGHYPLGTNIDFEINLPEEKTPIRGSGTISRRTQIRAEKIEGLGIRFTSFHGTDQRRLAAFLGANGLND
jgi:hypothetical protein